MTPLATSCAIQKRGKVSLGFTRVLTHPVNPALGQGKPRHPGFCSARAAFLA